jgi:hypothetical protein
MSRVAAGDVITVKPTNNMYTVLVIIAAVAELIAFVALFMKSTELFDKGLF